MSVESDLRAVLLAHAPLVAVVPAVRISVDAVQAGTPTPYIAFTTANVSPEWSSNNTLMGTIHTVDIQCVGGAPDLGGRATAIAVRELVQAALLAGGQPWAGNVPQFDDVLGLEVETVTVDWITG